MIAKANDQTWHIPQSTRVAAVERLDKIISGAGSKDRLAIAAVRALVAIDSLIVQRERLYRQQNEQNRILDVAEQLGIRDQLSPPAN